MRQRREVTSLPTRERELKLDHVTGGLEAVLSLPTRERELKRSNWQKMNGEQESLPTRERELKRQKLTPPASVVGRSPRGSVN